MFIFFTSQLNELKHLKIRQRQYVIALALSMLSPTSKVLLRVVKLLLLSPFFFMFVVFEGWLLLPFLLLAGLAYPLLTTPIEINFAKKHLTAALQQYQQGE
ncbi:DUF6170 family protein [Pseudoalteromonas sp.]|uniref:DUF6170 family protein n=1 Tax=Pseudoalteromonas sp. TaxID=53249 RepID=UPI003569792A